MRRRPAAMLRWHRARREHRRHRTELVRLVRLVVVAIERGYERVIGYTDARLKAERKRR